MRDCTIKLRSGVKVETVHVEKLRIVGYPTADEPNAADEPNGQKKAGLEPVGRNIKQQIKQEIKREME